jgi:molybdopterin synthase sulfur carrier subunit
MGDRLAADIYHVGLAPIVEMGKFRHNFSLWVLALEWHRLGARRAIVAEQKLFMSIKIKLFASLAESLQRREATVEYHEGMTVAGAWTAMSEAMEMPSGILVAVNMAYCEVDAVLSDGDEVAYFPPVTGG